jgi:hypothetical protein
MGIPGRAGFPTSSVPPTIAGPAALLLVPSLVAGNLVSKPRTIIRDHPVFRVSRYPCARSDSAGRACEERIELPLGSRHGKPSLPRGRTPLSTSSRGSGSASIGYRDNPPDVLRLMTEVGPGPAVGGADGHAETLALPRHPSTGCGMLPPSFQIGPHRGAVSLRPARPP